MSKIIIALPAYNEELTIGSMVSKSKQYSDKVTVIDDGSRDDTEKVAELAGAIVLRHETNKGKGAAIKTAFSYAKENNADILILLDADGQHNPDEIPKIIVPILNGEADIVNGSRFLGGSSENIPAYRRLGQEILTLTTKLAGKKIYLTDSQNGFRAFSKKTFDLFKFKNSGFAIESEMLMDAADGGARIVEVPISVRYDVPNPHSKDSLEHGFTVFDSLLKQLQQKRPLLYFGIPGLLMFLAGLYLGFETLYGYKSLGEFWIGKAVLMMIFLLLGTFSMFTGMILNAISIQLDRFK